PCRSGRASARCPTPEWPASRPLRATALPVTVWRRNISCLWKNDDLFPQCRIEWPVKEAVSMQHTDYTPRQETSAVCDYDMYDRIWQRVSPDLNPYPHVRGEENEITPPQPQQPSGCLP